MKLPHLLTLTLSAIALTTAFPSCAEKPVEKPKEEEVDLAKPRIVGRVASVPTDRKFVLIQSYGTWNITTGSVLTTQGPGGRAANLRVTGEKLGQYAAADIRSGTLEVGDGVYTISTPPKPPETTEPEENEVPPEENTQPETPEPEPEQPST